MKKYKKITTLIKLSKKNKGFLIPVFTIIVLLLIYTVKASPPASTYTLGETLAPTCSPGSTNCTVETPQAGHAYLTDMAAITGTQGDIIYFDGTDWVDLSPGTSGQFLKTLGSSSNPIWDTLASSSDFSDGGESGAADRSLGNTDNYDLTFISNNLSRLHIQNDGNIGIGTASPNNKLHITTSTNLDGLAVETTGENTPGITLLSGIANSATRNWGIAGNYGNYGDFVIRESNAKGGNPLSNGITRMTILSGGNIGIGTTNPGVKLDVSGDLNVSGTITGMMKEKITPKTSSFTIDINDIIAGVTYSVDTTSGEFVLTLPAASTIPVDGHMYKFNVIHNQGANNVRIQTHSGDEFSYNNTYFNLGSHLFSFTLGGMNDGSNAQWGIVSNLVVKASSHREASWSASNFSSMTIIPWDSEQYNSQDEIMVYTSGANARYTVRTRGTYKLSYSIDIDSTGGSTWNTTAQIYKNGVALSHTAVRTGNYAYEDQSMTLIPTYVDLDVDDYIDLRIDHNNLGGNLIHSMFNAELTL